MRKSLFCLVLVLVILPVYAKAQKEEVLQRDLSWIHDKKLVEEKNAYSAELIDKYGRNFSSETFTITLKKCTFKKNTVKIIYKNISDKDLYIFREVISTNNKYSSTNYDYVILDSKKEAAVYKGIIGDRFYFPYDDIDFVLVKAGETIKNEVDLSKFFELDANEVYTVQFKYGDIESNIIKIND